LRNRGRQQKHSLHLPGRRAPIGRSKSAPTHRLRICHYRLHDSHKTGKREIIKQKKRIIRSGFLKEQHVHAKLHIRPLLCPPIVVTSVARNQTCAGLALQPVCHISIAMFLQQLYCLRYGILCSHRRGHCSVHLWFSNPPCSCEALQHG
jgi:hypothetical protein